ncbi:helix-turn-helix transcriptional regulator [Listeria monocytogenes]|nr:helix-turn-helix transcriptional regulator [Listeria monocytogenes]EJT8453871.1 helix-turn-helix transcriptional regulator [Listeria monocytogenes]
MTAGENMKLIRVKKSMTQAKLADVSGVPQTTISGIEGGKTPTLIIAKKLADALEVTTDDLLKESERT